MNNKPGFKSSLIFASGTALLATTLSLPAQAGPTFSSWEEVGVAVTGGGCPIESRDGNWLYVASSAAGTIDIYAHPRKGRKGAFQERVMLGEPVSVDDANDFCPTPLAGWWLMFVSNRDRDGVEECGETDMYLTQYRPSPQKSFGDAMHLACAPDGPNTSGTEFAPSLVNTSDGTFLYFSSDVGGNQDIYVSTMAPDGSFSEGVAVAELNTSFVDKQPNVSRDGLTIVFASNRDDGGTGDIFMSERDSLEDAWGTPVNLSDSLDLTSKGLDESRPSLSWDMKRLYLGAQGTVYVLERKPGRN
jgi:Tol biopolymer transport system component